MSRTCSNDVKERREHEPLCLSCLQAATFECNQVCEALMHAMKKVAAQAPVQTRQRKDCSHIPEDAGFTIA
jgi:hypothetical protein